MGIVERLREGDNRKCPFDDKNCNLAPEDACPVCGDLGTWDAANLKQVPKCVASSYRLLASEAADEIEHLRSELSTARRAALLEGRRQAFDEVGQKAREYAALYPEASDGRNTFIIFAEWAEGKP